MPVEFMSASTMGLQYPEAPQVLFLLICSRGSGHRTAGLTSHTNKDRAVYRLVGDARPIGGRSDHDDGQAGGLVRRPIRF